MLYKDKKPTLITNPRYIIQNKIFLPSFFFFFFLINFILKVKEKIIYHEMHECNAMQILKIERKQNIKRRMVTKSIEMKHKDHVRKIQLD